MIVRGMVMYGVVSCRTRGWILSRPGDLLTLILSNFFLTMSGDIWMSFNSES